MVEVKKRRKKKVSDSGRKYRWLDKFILIVEDERTNHMLIDLMLRPTSARLLWAMDGKKAVELCEEHEDLSIVLMDIRLPKMNGYEATKEIRKFRPDIPIIAQTAYVMEEEKHKVIEVGCNDLITKPIKKDLLLRKISKYIDKKKK
jgi:two-component system cell cycle response regulator DivK